MLTFFYIKIYLFSIQSPAFVDDCVNLETAVKRLLWGKFNNAGQICVAPDYVLCTKVELHNIMGHFLEGMTFFYSVPVLKGLTFLNEKMCAKSPLFKQ